ncbi:dehydrogenase [Lactobacillus selangorensis]|uniref:Dehydrogenase n=1 Tax=Lactobacillus selangorensis TaxID=81857 RepID=A0A0R2G3D4_9LACO|nr:NAD-dependent epimerase/dehydratase family protein [Lactobacillus selangorensis]KRN28881.1 dehydrogenase [Lactobacillus selangorensis]KRN32709.1 dehydrogenase [Lactobacillus selangorensis]
MKTVVVTGGSGFVAGWVIVAFLKKGYAVKTSLRNLKKADRVKQEIGTQVLPAQLNKLSFFAADLTSEDGWADAMQGAAGVIHVASPLGNGTQSTAEMVAIAKGGTLNVLKAAVAAQVPRVVMTSSQAASTPENKIGAVTLDESYWSDPENPELDPYRISKIKAEQAAWEYIGTQTTTTLTTILPGAIYGPSLSAHAISSNAILLQILNGLPVIPKVPMETSDVRDLAQLHLLAFEKPAAIGKRYLAASQKITMPEIARLYKQHFPDSRTHTLVAPNWLLKAAALVVPSLRSLVPMLGRQYRHSTAAAEHDLGWEQHTPAETVLDAARSLKKLGLVKTKTH